MASETAPGCFACPAGRPRQLRPGHQSRRRPQATFHGSADAPLVSSRLPQYQSRPATLRRVFLKRGRQASRYRRCVRPFHVRVRRPGQFCSRARVLAAASPFFSTKKEREKSTSEPRLANAKPGRTRIRIGGTVVRPVAIGGPIGHQFRSGHGLSAEAGVHVPRAAPVIPGSGKSGRKIRSRWTAGGGCFPSALSNSFDGVPTSLRLEDEAPSERWLSVI